MSPMEGSGPAHKQVGPGARVGEGEERGDVSSKVNSNTQKLLEDVFEAYGTPQGERRDGALLLDAPQWDAFCLECKLVEGDVQLSDLQAVFSDAVKHAGKPSRMNFVHFVDALANVAEKKYGASDSIARLVYFKIVRFGRSGAHRDRSALEETSVGGERGGGAGGGGEEGGEGGGHPTFSANGTLLVSAFEHYRDCVPEASRASRSLAATADAAFGGSGIQDTQLSLITRLRGPTVRAALFGGASEEEAGAGGGDDGGQVHYPLEV
ncbi:hypothetical protein T484DRAFT_1763775 [Baffinella frigidus]|nr:hypothetical protein T484DRAFT_1763775 [Cryptophyta sp. CCMP2293]